MPCLRKVANGLNEPAMTNNPAINKPGKEGSGAATRVGENTGLATPGSFCSKVSGPVPLT